MRRFFKATFPSINPDVYEDFRRFFAHHEGVFCGTIAVKSSREFKKEEPIFHKSRVSILLFMISFR